MRGRPLNPTAQDAPGNAIVADEERLLANVAARVATAGVEPGALLDYDRELLELRDAIAEAKPEDLPPLVEQMARVQGIAARRGRSRALPVDAASPYFAHMRLKDERGERDVLVGKRGFIDRAGGVQIVDWRNAPVSQIYYRYEEGDDYDETFEGGRLHGVVAARRNVSIMGGRLRRVGCPQGTFVRDARGVWFEAEGQAIPVLQGGQGTAVRPPRPAPPPRKDRHGRQDPARQQRNLGVHGGMVPRADKHLPEIAALIDREQFDLISHPTSGLVVIQGGAGSGKTTVALHRVAFLNFQDPKRFGPRRMLVVVPSTALARYIEGVLPSLGVTGVPVVTYREWASGLRRKLLPRLGDRYADDTPDAVAHVKKHPALLAAVEAHVGQQAAWADAELAAACAAVDVPGALARWRELAAVPLVPRCRKLLGWLTKHEAELPPAARVRLDSVLRRLKRRVRDVVRDWEELLTDEAALAAAFAGVTDVTRAELTATLRWTVRQRDTASAEEYAGIDRDRLEPIDHRFVASLRPPRRAEPDHSPPGGPRLDEGDDEDGQAIAGQLDAEDDPLLLRLYQRKHGGLIDKEGHETRYEHIAIDEAQDLSPIEVKVLLEATTPQRCVTIAGDTAQRLVFDNSFRDWASLLRDAGHVGVEIRPLRLSYRSTAEVMQFAQAILGPLADAEAPLVARNGAPVELHGFGEIGEAVGFLGEALRSLAGREPTASVAIIARHPEQADAYYAALARAEVPALRRVRRQDFAFAPGVDVTDVAQVKGLEFDYVILVEVTAANYPDSLEARHMLHIAATRAAHQLWLILTGEPSPLLPGTLLEDALI